MILRRFMKHVTDQNWFAVGLDVLVVITGIFLGMQVTDWNDVRKENGEEANYLERLQNDMEVSITLADDRIRDIQKHLDSQYALILASEPDAAKPSLEELDQYIHNGLFMYSTLITQQKTIDELQNSGKMFLIKNQDLKSALEDLVLIFQNIKFDETDISKLVTDKIDPFIIKNYDARHFERYADSDYRNNKDKRINPLPLDEKHLLLLQNTEFKNLVIYRNYVQNASMNHVLAIKDQYIKILSLTNKRLSSLNAKI